MATPHGLEPRSRVLETPILPLNYGVINLVRSEGFEPPTLTFVASCSKSNWSYKRIGGNGWIRTTDRRRMKAVLYQLNYVTVKWSEWLDSNQRPPGSKPGRLPTDLHSEYWCSHTESNCEWRITKPQLYHLTIGAKNLVEDERIELSISGCKPDVFPLALIPQILAGLPPAANQTFR